MIRERFNFETPDSVADWSAIDDSVMGGQSASRLIYDGTGFAAFKGTVSLARGGGFASVRSRALDPQRVRQIELMVADRQAGAFELRVRSIRPD